MSTAPVSGSTSTSQMWQPLGHVAPATVLVEGQAENVDGALRDRGGEPLTHCLQRGENLDLTLPRHSDRHTLLENIRAGPLDERRHAAAAQTPARFSVGSTRVEAAPIREDGRLVHDRLELAAVVRLV